MTIEPHGYIVIPNDNMFIDLHLNQRLHEDVLALRANNGRPIAVLTNASTEKRLHQILNLCEPSLRDETLTVKIVGPCSELHDAMHINKHVQSSLRVAMDEYHIAILSLGGNNTDSLNRMRKEETCL